MAVGDLSLLGYKARSAQAAHTCTRLIISTDDAEIMAEAARLGVETPFVRPAELATDGASTVDVISHAMEWIETNTDEKYDALMLLEPSSPFAQGRDYDAAAKIMEDRQANLVVGMRETEVNSAFVGPLDDDGRMAGVIEKILAVRMLRRQDHRAEYTMNGALYLVRWEFFKRRKAIYCDPNNSYGYVMDRFHSIEIDEPIDLEWARFMVDRRLLDVSAWADSSGRKRTDSPPDRPTP